MSKEQTNELPEEVQLHAAFAINGIMEQYCPGDIEACENTSERWVNAMGELLSGYGMKPRLTIFPAKTKDLIIQRKIKYYSLCRHHLLPFYGHVYIAYLPVNSIIGLSKFSRITEMYSRRLQVQEDLTHEIALKVMNVLKTDDVMVIITGEHLCERMRGAENDEDGSLMVTSTTQGRFRTDPVLRSETIRLMGLIE